MRDYLVTKSLTANQETLYAVDLPALNFALSDGSRFEFPPARAELRADKAKHKLAATVGWPLLRLSDDTKEIIILRDLSFNARHDSAGVPWFGDFQAQARVIAFGDAPEKLEPGAPAAPFRPDSVLRKVSVQAETVQRGERFDVAYDLSAEKYQLAFFEFEKLHAGVRLNRLALEDVKMLDKVLGFFGPLASPSKPSEADRSTGLKQFCHRVALGGAVLELDEMSGSFRGSTFSMKGNITLKNVKAADFASINTLLGKMVARLDMRISPRLIREIVQLISSADDPPKYASGTAAALEEDLASAPVKAAIADGSVRLENGQLRSTFELNDGKFTANGIPVPISEEWMVIASSLLSGG